MTVDNLLASNKSILSVNNLAVSFATKSEVIADIAFTLDEGKTLAIVGESGSGKSVTALSILRLLESSGGRIERGEILFRNKQQQLVDLTKISSKQIRQLSGAEIAMIFQEPMTSLNPIFTVGQQIVEAVMLHQNLSYRQATQQAIEVLNKVRIAQASNVFKRYAHQISGGMRQRVMIAMALVCRPKLIIADEPTTALDVTVQAQIMQLLRELQKELNMALLFITHDMGLVAQMADKVLVMRAGKSVEYGSVEQVLTQPKQAYTKALLQAVPKLGQMQGINKPQPFALFNPDVIEPETSTSIEKQDKLATLMPDYQQPALLQVKNLSVQFPIRSGILNRVSKKVHAVEQIDFSLYANETLAIVGESGCGKSTTGRALTKLIQPQQGQVLFNGQDIMQLPKEQLRQLRSKIQYVFQDPYASLDPRLTIGYSIMQPLLINNLADKYQAKQRAIELLECVGLRAENMQGYPSEFSGGQRQRICIARALAAKPQVLILDEAVSALDVSVQAQVINLLLELQQKFGLAMLFISHNMAVVERVSHRVAVMYLGQIVEIGPRQAVFESPQHPYTKQLLAAVPRCDIKHRPEFKPVLTDLPSAIKPIDYVTKVQPLVDLGNQHFVAKHSIDNFY